MYKLQPLGAGLVYQRGAKNSPIEQEAEENFLRRLNSAYPERPTLTNQPEQRKPRKRKSPSTLSPQEISNITASLQRKRKTSTLIEQSQQPQQQLRLQQQHAQHPQQQRQQPPNKKQKVGIWNTDAHLQVADRLHRSMKMFEKVVTFYIHPALLDKENLEWFFYSEETAYPSPLALNLDIAGCIGASCVGDHVLASEYFQRTRDQAGALLDEIDFNVAYGLMMVGVYCCWRKNISELGIYCSVAGLQTCEQLGMINNPVYARLLVTSYLTLYTQKAEFQTFENKVKRMRAAPRMKSTKRFMLRHIQQKGKEREKERKGKGKGTENEKEREKESEIENKQENEFATEQEELDLGMDYLLQDVMIDTGILWGKLVSAGPPDPQLLVEEMEYFGVLEFKWNTVMHVFKPAQQIIFNLYLSSTQALIATAASATDTARKAAMRFLEYTNHELWPFLLIHPPSIRNALMVLHAFRNENSEPFLQLIAAVRKLRRPVIDEMLIAPFVIEADRMLNGT